MTLWSDDFLRVFLLLAECFISFHALGAFCERNTARHPFACLAGQKNPTFRELTHRNPEKLENGGLFFSTSEAKPESRFVTRFAGSYSWHDLVPSRDPNAGEDRVGSSPAGAARAAQVRRASNAHNPTTKDMSAAFSED